MVEPKKGPSIDPSPTQYRYPGRRGEIELLFGHEFNFRSHWPTTTAETKNANKYAKNHKLMHVGTRKLIKAITLCTHPHFPYPTARPFWPHGINDIRTHKLI